MEVLGFVTAIAIAKKLILSADGWVSGIESGKLPRVLLAPTFPSIATAAKSAPRRWLAAGLFLAVLFISHDVQAVGIPAPNLQTGQYVYTVPGDFDPPLIGKSGLAEIQAEAKKLHFPYYVVVANDYGGTSTEELSGALDGLADQWAKNPKFDRSTSSIAVLTYSPRKYRILAGSKWRATLGMEGQEGGQRFVDIFSSYVKGSSKDPKSGIIESMKALDTEVFEKTDPHFLAVQAAAAKKAAAQQAEADRKAEVQRQFQNVHNQLNSQIGRAESLLAQTPYLPADTSAIKDALQVARKARLSDQIPVMAGAADDLKAEADHLEQFVNARRRVEQAKINAAAQARRDALAAKQKIEDERRMHQANIISFVLAMLLLFGGAFFMQWRRFSSASGSFKRKTADWEEALFNAANNYTRFFEERRSVTELAETSGETKEKYEEVTREVGAIYPTIEAMRDRIAECKVVASGATFFRVRPLQKALALLDADFEFDTDTLNRESIFAPPIRVIKIKPAQLRKQLDETYTENIADWDELMEALKLRQTVAQDAFPTADLTQMLDLATQKGVPHRWFASHPLFGDDESDRCFYEELNAVRLTDPLAFKHRIETVTAAQNAQKNLLQRLIDALALVDSKRVRILPAYGATVVASTDDPAVTLSAAFRADELLAGYLATKTDAAEIEAQANLAAELYERAMEQAATLDAAIKGAEGDIAALSTRLEAAQNSYLAAKSRLQEARLVHADTGAAAASLESCRLHLEAAAGLLKDSQRLLAQSRHLEAQHQVQKANNELASADQEAAQCIANCEQLDTQKRAYELQLSRMAASRAGAELSLQRYGRNRRLNDFNPGISDGPLNYALMMVQINSYQQELDEEVRRARLSYEEEQARIARAAELQRQQDSASSFSSSSSSGSNWDSGSSSSSGSDWSSSSSSSSSGTDW